MQPLNSAALFLQKLNQSGLSYMVTGSIAAIVYGEPRLTHDLDVVVALSSVDIPRMQSLFPESEFYLPPADILTIELKRRERGHFNVIHHESGFKADFYLLKNDPLHTWAFSRLIKMDFLGETLFVAPPEYVILRKLQFFREGGSEKHLRDIASMLTVSAERIDRKLIDDKSAALGLSTEWKRAQDFGGTL